MRQPDRHQLSHRHGQLVVVATFGGMLLALTSVVAVAHPHVLRDLGFVVFAGCFAAPVGAGLGLMTSPLVVFCLRRKTLSAAVALVYGSTFVVVVLVTRHADVILAPVAALPALFTMSLLAHLVLPDVISKYGAGHCTKCDYDLRHVPHLRCPECGLPVPGTSAAARRRSPRRLVSSCVRSPCVRQALLCVSLLAGAWIVVAQWIGATAFSPNKFHTIEPGMDRKQVRSLLGPPDRCQRRHGVDHWRYDDGTWIATRARYYVYFVNDGVADTEVDWW